MAQNKFLKNTLAGLAVAAVAAGLLTSAGAFDGPGGKNTASGRLAATCGITYDKAVYTELHKQIEPQAVALQKLGLGDTKDDVCAAVRTVVDDKQTKDYVVYDHSTKVTRAVLAAALMYQASHQEAKLSKDTVRSLGNAFEVGSLYDAPFKKGTATPALIRDEGVAFITMNLALAGKGDLDSSSMKNKDFGTYVYDLNLSP